MKRRRGALASHGLPVGLLAIVVALAVAACGSSHSSSAGTDSSSSTASTKTASTNAASTCKGTPAKIVAITNESNPLTSETPELVSGAQAAADAVTKSCELGRPLKVIGCDDKYSSNSAAACGREAVADKAIAVVSYSAWGDSFIPITTKAGIPSVGNNATSSDENTSPLSFPGQYPITDLLGEITAAVSLGAHHLALPALDIPSVNFFIALATEQAKALGATVTTIHVAPTATNMTPYAGQIISDKSQAVLPVIGTGQVVGLVKALVAQGANLKTTKVVSDLTVFTPATIKQIGSAAPGLYATGTAYSPSDTSNPAIARYLSELKAAGLPSGPTDVSTVGIQGWAGVHVIADALKGQSAITAKELVKRLNTAGVADYQKYAMPAINYTKPALPIPALAKLRLFSSTISVWGFNASSTSQLLSKGFIPATKPMKLKPVGN